MKILLIIAIFFLVILAYNFISIRRMIKNSHNNRFESREEHESTKAFRSGKVDKSKAEDVHFEEVEEEK